MFGGRTMGTTDDELAAALDMRAHERAEQLRINRFSRFVDAGYTFEQADVLERAGADYHLADQLRAASCPAELAMRILGAGPLS